MTMMMVLDCISRPTNTLAKIMMPAYFEFAEVMLGMSEEAA